MLWWGKYHFEYHAKSMFNQDASSSESKPIFPGLPIPTTNSNPELVNPVQVQSKWLKSNKTPATERAQKSNDPEDISMDNLEHDHEKIMELLDSLQNDDLNNTDLYEESILPESTTSINQLLEAKIFDVDSLALPAIVNSPLFRQKEADTKEEFSIHTYEPTFQPATTTRTEEKISYIPKESATGYSANDSEEDDEPLSREQLKSILKMKSLEDYHFDTIQDSNHAFEEKSSVYVDPSEKSNSISQHIQDSSGFSLSLPSSIAFPQSITTDSSRAESHQEASSTASALTNQHIEPDLPRPVPILPENDVKKQELLDVILKRIDDDDSLKAKIEANAGQEGVKSPLAKIENDLKARLLSPKMEDPFETHENSEVSSAIIMKEIEPANDVPTLSRKPLTFDEFINVGAHVPMDEIQKHTFVDPEKTPEKNASSIISDFNSEFKRNPSSAFNPEKSPEKNASSIVSDFNVEFKVESMVPTRTNETKPRSIQQNVLPVVELESPKTSPEQTPPRSEPPSDSASVTSQKQTESKSPAAPIHEDDPVVTQLESNISPLREKASPRRARSQSPEVQIRDDKLTTIQIESRQLDKSPEKSPVKSPIKSPVKSPVKRTSVSSEAMKKRHAVPPAKPVPRRDEEDKVKKALNSKAKPPQITEKFHYKTAVQKSDPKDSKSSAIRRLSEQGKRVKPPPSSSKSIRPSASSERLLDQTKLSTNEKPKAPVAPMTSDSEAGDRAPHLSANLTFSSYADRSQESLIVPLYEIEELQQNITILRKKLSSTSHNLERKTKECEELKKELDIVEKIRTLEVQNEVRVERVEVSDNEMKLRKEIEEQERLLGGYQNENEKLVAQIKELRRHLLEQDAQHTKKEEQYLNEISILKTQQKVVQAPAVPQTAIWQRRSEELLYRVEDLMEQLNTEKGESGRQISLLKVRVKELENDTEFYRTEFSKAKKEYESLKSDYDKVIDQRDRLKTQSSRIPKLSSTDNTRISELEKTIVQLEKELAERRQGEKEALRPDVSELEKKVEMLEKELAEKASKQNDILRPEMSEQKRSEQYLQEIENLMHQIELRDKLHAEEIAKLSVQVPSFDEKPISVNPPSADIQSVVEHNLELQRLISEQMSQMQINRADYEKAHKKLQERITNYEGLIAGYETKIEDLQKSLKKARLFTEEEVRYLEEANKLKVENETINMENNKLRNQLEISEATRKAIHENTMTILRQAQEESSRIALQHHERALSVLRAQTTSQTTEMLDLELGKLIKYLREAESDNADLKRRNSDLSHRIEDLEKGLMKADTPTDVLKVSHESNIIALKENIDGDGGQLLKKIAVLEDMNREKTLLLKRTQDDSLRELKKLETSYQALVAKKNDEIRRFKEEMDDLILSLHQIQKSA